jgi:SAM-dependent methyltransferase
MMNLSLAQEFLLVSTVRRLRAHAPPLYRLVSRFAPEAAEGKDTVDYVAGVYKKFASYVKPAAPIRTLELGPGPNLGVSVLFATQGHTAFAVDIADLRTEAAAELHEEVMDLADELIGSSFARLRHPSVEYVLGLAEEIPLEDGSIDFIFSNATFEHVRDVHRAAAENWRVLAPGGRAVHQIDMRDHRHFDSPLTYLQYGDLTWRWMNPVTAAGYQNRWRLSEYVAAFGRCGFRVSVEKRELAPAEVRLPREYLAPRYRSAPEEDLSVTSCVLVADKPSVH